MSSTSTQSESYSYTKVDVENVIRRFKTDLMMIADSTKAISNEKAQAYAHDMEVLAKLEFLKWIDVTLLNGTTEVKAVRYNVVTGSGGLSADRPGGVLWPKVANPVLRVVFQPAPEYYKADESALASKLQVKWGDSTADTSHQTLAAGTGREYSSNGYGMTRKDYQ